MLRLQIGFMVFPGRRDVTASRGPNLGDGERQEIDV